jgi:hypothetical protein
VQVDIVSVQDEAHNGRADDARKFLGQPPRGYVLTCDDDLIYPRDYADYMIRMLSGARKAWGPCIVSLMGRVMRGQAESYYRDKENAPKFDWRSADGIVRRIDIPGSGVMIYHTDDIRFSMDDFPHENMAARESVQAWRVPPPRKDWIKYQPVADTIWDLYHKDDELQTRLANTLVKP